MLWNSILPSLTRHIDLFSVAIIVSEGQTVRAGETTIAWFGGVAGWPVRID